MGASRLRTVSRHQAEETTDQVRTLLPARVVEYDTVRGLATVDVLANDAEGRSIGRVWLCPVAHPRWGPWAVSAPLDVGVNVWIACADQSIEEFQRTATTYTPGDPRRHDLSDAVVWPSCSVAADPCPGLEENAFVIAGPDGLRVRITREGKIQIMKGAVDLLALFDRLLAQLELAKVATLMGPQPLDPDTLIELGLIRLDLTDLKV